MSWYTPLEGREMFGNLILTQTDVDRGVDSDLILFTNTTTDDNTAASALTQPSGSGYAAITLDDDLWTNVTTDDLFEYAQQTFTPTADDWPAIYGAARVSKGTTPRIMSMYMFASPKTPTATDGDSIKITPKQQFTSVDS